MRLGLVLLAVTASSAAARPARPPINELQDPFREAPPACEQGKTWPKLRACLEKGGVHVNVLHDVEGAKLVSLVTEGAASTPLRLYVNSGEVWRQASFFGVDNANSELLAFKRVGVGRYRIDQGMLLQTTAVVGNPATSKRMWLRRRLTTLCTDTACRTVITACDAMVDGKMYWAFRGTLYAQGTSLFVVGDKSHAGTHCMPAPSMFRQEPLGDPLE